MPSWLEAGLWGLQAGSALLFGAGLGYLVRIPARAIATVMAFGSGVLISALSFELMDEAYGRGGFLSSAAGFLSRAVIFTAANVVLAKRGGKHRKRSNGRQPSEKDQPGSGLAIAIGALLDGIPESIAIGLSMLAGGAVSTVTVIAIFLSNVPEGLSSSAGMRKAGRSRIYVFGLWTVIAVASGAAAGVGNGAFAGVSAGFRSAVTAVAAGAILAMLADTMMPEAFEEAHNLAGLLTVVGFLSSFVLSKLK